MSLVGSGPWHEMFFLSCLVFVGTLSLVTITPDFSDILLLFLSLSLSLMKFDECKKQVFSALNKMIWKLYLVIDLPLELQLYLQLLGKFKQAIFKMIAYTTKHPRLLFVVDVPVSARNRDNRSLFHSLYQHSSDSCFGQKSSTSVLLSLP